MITDFHVHTFPDAIAPRALSKLSKSADMQYRLDGTLETLQHSMQTVPIGRSVLLPVATSKKQYQTINRTALQINEQSSQTGILSFGGIHPDNENYREIIRDLAAHNIRGIKLHPVFQGVYLDDIRNLRIIECACEFGMAVTVHAGYDISFPGQDYATPEHILSMLEQIHPDKLILAHLGAWGCWDEVERSLAGADIWFDTSFTLTPIERRSHRFENQLSSEQFCRIVRKHGSDRIVFGSDSPWADQAEAVRALQKSGLSVEEQEQILSTNARLLLGEPQD